MTTITSLDTATRAPGGSGFITAICTFLRAATTTAYASGDVISDDAVTTAKCMVFDTGTSGIVTSVVVGYEETDTANLELWLFDAEPTNFLDNAALALVSADVPKVVAKYTLPDAVKTTVGTNVNVYLPVGQTLADALGMGSPFVSANGKLYGLLVTRSVFTPISAAKVHVKLGIALS